MLRDDFTNTAIMLPPDILQFLRQLGQEACRMEFAPYLVGGMVRDALLELPAGDVDIVVVSGADGDGITLAKHLFTHWQVLFPMLISPVAFEKFDRFRTAKLKFDESFFGSDTLDIASARSETYSAGGQPPTVQLGSLADDLARRDFSSNAIALDISPNKFNTLIDPHQGAADLLKRELRILHTQSFRDDPMRILRGLRLIARLGFHWEQETAACMEQALSDRCLTKVSKTRRYDELRKVLSEDCAVRVVELLQHYRIFPQLFEIEGIQIKTGITDSKAALLEDKIELWEARLLQLLTGESSEIVMQILRGANVPSIKRKKLLEFHQRLRILSDNSI